MLLNTVSAAYSGSSWDFFWPDGNYHMKVTGLKALNVDVRKVNSERVMNL